jgi:cyclopropane fatty-acyl-phospholipid synthase-like methyltransferase
MMDRDAYENDPQAYWNQPRPEGESIEKTNAVDERGIALFNAQVIPEAHVNPGRRVCLDLGCGGGRYIPSVAPMFGKVIGVDFSQSNLETARRSIDAMGLKNVELMLLDLDDMWRVEDNYADFAYSVAVFMHMPNDTKKKALKELARVLASGGVAVLIEIIPIDIGAFDCPEIEEQEWQEMIEEAGLKVESISPADPFTKFKLTKGGN